MGTLLIAGLILVLDSGSTPVTFVVAAALFAVFSVPIFAVVRERAVSDYRFRVQDAVGSWAQLATTLQDARRVPGLLRFLVARFFYTDPVNTVIVVMAVFATEAIGLSKVSVQTGTSHGGVPLPGGGVAEVKLDFETLRVLGVVAREYGLAGAVQHGASTLPGELFHRFPEVETAEIHLATGFQNALYEHEAFPAELYASVERFCFEQCADERKEGETDTQFVYKTRKKALGEHKRELWDLENKDDIVASQQAKMGFLFEQLGITGNKAVVDRFVTAPERHKPIPAGLVG